MLRMISAALLTREGVPLGRHLRNPGVVDGDRVVEGILSGIDAVGLCSQCRMAGQGAEAAGLDSGAERTEDPLGDQQGVQVVLAQRALGRALEAVGDEIVEQSQSAAESPHALHRGALALQLGLVRGEGVLQAREDACDLVLLPGVGKAAVPSRPLTRGGSFVP